MQSNITDIPITTNTAYQTTHFLESTRSVSSCNEKFDLCYKLNKYGCNPTSIPQIVELYINSGISDYTLPTNPCLYDTVNMSWIFTIIDKSTLDLVTDNSYFATIPCQLLMQLSDILEQREIEYLIQEDYWFGDNGACDTRNITNNLYQSIECNCNSQNQNSSNMTSLEDSDICYDDENCLFPFAKTRYRTDYLESIGQCHCRISCEVHFFKGDIAVLVK